MKLYSPGGATALTRRDYRGTFYRETKVRIPKPEEFPEQQVLRWNIDFSHPHQEASGQYRP